MAVLKRQRTFLLTDIAYEDADCTARFCFRLVAVKKKKSNKLFPTGVMESCSAEYFSINYSTQTFLQIINVILEEGRKREIRLLVHPVLSR